VSDELEAIEARRAARRQATEDAKALQYVVDMKALDALEEKHGEGAVKPLHVPHFAPGLPTMVIVKSPAGSPSYKRFCDLVREAKGHQGAIAAAAEQLARACIVYPEAAVLVAMVEAFPNTLADAANVAAGFVQLKTEAEKKG
jgi:hypothetical protein